MQRITDALLPCASFSCIPLPLNSLLFPKFDHCSCAFNFETSSFLGGSQFKLSAIFLGQFIIEVGNLKAVKTDGYLPSLVTY